MEKEIKQPKNKYRIGNLTLTEWENTNKEGKPFSSFTMESSYKDGEEWKNSPSFTNLHAAKAVLEMALSDR